VRAERARLCALRPSPAAMTPRPQGRIFLRKWSVCRMTGTPVDLGQRPDVVALPAIDPSIEACCWLLSTSLSAVELRPGVLELHDDRPPWPPFPPPSSAFAESIRSRSTAAVQRSTSLQ